MTFTRTLHRRWRTFQTHRLPEGRLCYGLFEGAALWSLVIRLWMLTHPCYNTVTGTRPWFMELYCEMCQALYHSAEIRSAEIRSDQLYRTAVVFHQVGLIHPKYSLFLLPTFKH